MIQELITGGKPVVIDRFSGKTAEIQIIAGGPWIVIKSTWGKELVEDITPVNTDKGKYYFGLYLINQERRNMK